MDEEAPPSFGFYPISRPISPRLGLFVVLIASMLSVFSAVAWIFRRIHQIFGKEIAEVAVAFLAILILGLILTGVGVGFGTVSALRKRQDQAERVYCLFGWCKTFREFRSYLGLEVPAQSLPTRIGLPNPINKAVAVEGTYSIQQTVTIVPASSAVEDPAWTHDLREEVTKPGRPPEHSIHLWARVVAAWERRNLWHESITLDEFLRSEFGEYADGTPQVSRSTFYEWRRKVHQAAKKQTSR